MGKYILFILFITQFILAEATLKIENFIENGDGTVSFDIMMMNDVPVQAIQMTLLSGDGAYTYNEWFDNDYCICGIEDLGDGIYNGVIPDGCDECYYDNGVDFVANAYEPGYNSDAGYLGNTCSMQGDCAGVLYDTIQEGYCEEHGYCSNGNSSSDYYCFINGMLYEQFDNQTLCEAAGLDSNGNICDGSGDDCTALGYWVMYSFEFCEESGACSNVEYINECDCLQNGAVWTSDNNIWYPDNIWNGYYLPSICIENNYEWNYAERDASGDDYRQLVQPGDCNGPVNCWAFPDDPCCATGFQFCRLPGINSYDPSPNITYQEYIGLDYDGDNYDVSGHCSQRDSYCRDLEQCWGAEAGLACDNGFPDGCCNNSLNPDWLWQSPYRDYEHCTENGFIWTAYDTQAVCETYGGIWVGSEDGTQGNKEYDLGENFIDTDRNLDITSINNLPAGFFAQESGDEMLIFSFSGDMIDATSSYESLATITASITGDAGTLVTLGARNICKDNYQLHCVSEMIISDANAERIDASFVPSIWTIGSDVYSIDSGQASSDGICSLYAGETMLTDDSCPSICGDYYCDSAAGENYLSCKIDCPDAVAGDGYCNLYEGEHAGNTSDCTEFGCGDYYCNSETETVETCPSDCLSYCGNGFCDVGENDNNCNMDCIPFTGVYGDINNDGILNVLDVLIALNIILEFGYNEVGDINSDGFLDILDIVAMVYSILNP